VSVTEGGVAQRYRAECLEHNIPAQLPGDALRVVYLRVVNRGDWIWSRSPEDGHSIDCAFFCDGELVTTVPLDCAELAPGEETMLSLKWRTPAQPGLHTLRLDMVEQGISYFGAESGPLAEIDVEVIAVEKTESERMMDSALVRNYWFYIPSEGIFSSANAPPYPLFVKEAVGPHFYDLEGRRFIDYVMGWGSYFLGYAHPDVQAAIGATLDQGCLPTLPHELQMLATEELCHAFSGADMALFGKNGSDVVTAGVRLARLSTGRTHVLFSGFHGWQDWSNPLPGNAPPISRFAYGDLAQVEQLLDEHDGNVAAIVVEPAAQVEGVDGPVRAADAAFLGGLRALCDRTGAVLIFDEIWTGFRYLSGSVQRHTGVAPDLTALGKSLSNGMPLGALIGRRDLFTSSIHRIGFNPTFAGDIYSFAAALAALRLYAAEDVPARVWAYGRRLMDGVNALCAELGLPAQMVGLPIRMVFAFQIEDQRRRTAARTLLQQELLKKGVLCFRGFMLPSAAHGELELDQTLEAYAHALRVVAGALERDAWVSLLEIPAIR
jgi:glutamate-1-semialdehyde aminotransferase